MVDLSCEIVLSGSLDKEMKSRMFQLFRLYYCDVDFERFCQDMLEKTHVLLLWDHIGSEPFLFGFSTILRKTMNNGAVAIYSGDTVVDKAYWGNKLLQVGFARFLWTTKFLNPTRPVYWMLLSKGFKTYMLIRRNFFHSYPNFERAAPKKIQEAKDQFYSEKFGSNYKDSLSLIDFGQSLGRVKDGSVNLPAETLKNTDIAYFFKANPRFADGIELACIAEVRLRDVFRICWKYFIGFGRQLFFGKQAVQSPEQT
jgi:hypothetical protein